MWPVARETCHSGGRYIYFITTNIHQQIFHRLALIIVFFNRQMLHYSTTCLTLAITPNRAARPFAIAIAVPLLCRFRSVFERYS